MRCYRCMREYGDDLTECPHCGYHCTADMEPSCQLPPGTMVADRYWIGVVLGKGGFGITYKAFDTKLNITVALKEYYPIGLAKRDTDKVQVACQSVDKHREFHAGLHRFLEEARNLARFSKNPNIVDVFHFFKENGTGYIVMEYLDGISMKYFLKVNEGKMAVLYAKEIVLAVAKALEVLHTEGILHRDVSPDNIFLCSDGKIKLIDFGSSRLSDEDDREVIVKPGYAPPEQYRKDSVQGPWTDIYALGATFYSAITGCVPPEAPERLKEDLLVRPSDWNEEIPAYIDSIILKAMALKERERFAHAVDMAEALMQCRTVAVPKTQKERRQLRGRRRRIGICVGMLLLICVGGLLCRWLAAPRGELQVWLCAEDKADIEQLEADYNQMSSDWTAAWYPDMKVSVHVEKQSEYQQHLMNALRTGDGPDVFESTDMADEVYPYSAELTDCAERIDQKESCYFLTRYQTYFPKCRQLPIGFDVAVIYVLQQAGRNVVIPDEVDDTYVYDASKTQLAAFLDGQLPYLVGAASDYGAILTAYDQQAVQGKVEGIIEVYPTGDKAMYRTMNVKESCTHRQRKMAELYLAYLLSGEGQQMLVAPVDSEQNLSVNCRVDGEDRGKLRKKLSVLEQQLEEYR